MVKPPASAETTLAAPSTASSRFASVSAPVRASQATIDSLKNYEKLMTEKGVKISEIDIKPFIASTGVVYEKLGYTELRKQVNAILGR